MDDLLRLLEELTIDEMANTFHLEYLKTIPEFDGTPNLLTEFVRAVEIISNKFLIAGQDQFLQSIILSAIRTKLKGKALLITSGRDIATWEDLKRILQKSFADQRSEDSLLRDLMLLKQRHETAQEYHEKCIGVRSLLYSNVQLIENNADVRRVKQTLYDSLTLKAYLSGLKEPLGSFLRAKGPTTMEDAMTYVIEEENVYYNRSREATELQRKNSALAQQRKPIPNTGLRMVNSHNIPKYIPQQPRQQFQNFTQPFVFANNPRPMSFPNDSRSRSFPNQNHYSANSRNTRNVFAPRNQTQPRPTPMDTSSGNTRRSVQPQQNRPQNSTISYIRPGNPQNRNFISEELFYQNNPDEEPYENYYDDVINDQNNDYPETEEDFEIDAVSEETNFTTTASTNNLT